jgi:outer membrane protein OmpA-like peptidoglycan-associated protein
MNKQYLKPILASALITVILSGCISKTNLPSMQNTDGTINRTQTGTIIGGLLGAIIGGNTSNKKGKRVALGGIAGAAIGAGIGYSLEEQAQEVAQTLNTQVDNNPKSENDANKELIVSNTDKFVKIMFRDPMMFQTNSSRPTASALLEIKEMIPALQNPKYTNTIIQVIGHTDSRGSYSYNKKLSEARASSVAHTIYSEGINNAVYAKGCSFSKPIAQNTSKANMALNRRVEIYLYPNQKSVIDPCVN